MNMSSETKKSNKSRRQHSNSKTGCPTCKKRRIKCTEELPSCSCCIKHKVKCGYLDFTEAQLKELLAAKAAAAAKKESSNSGTSLSGAASAAGAGSATSNEEVDLRLADRQKQRFDLTPHRSHSLNSVQSGKSNRESPGSSDSPENASNSPASGSFTVPTNKPSTNFVKHLSTSSSSMTSATPHHSISSTSGFPPSQYNLSRSSSSGGNFAGGGGGGDSAFSSYFSLIGGVSNALSIDQREITQNFDNLLPTSTEDPENSIIYPVYSIGEAHEEKFSPSWRQQYQQSIPGKEKSNESSLSEQQKQLHAQTQGVKVPSHFFKASIEALIPQSLSHSTIGSPLIKGRKTSAGALYSGALPGAILSDYSFPLLTKVKYNYVNLFVKVLYVSGPKIAKGICPLDEIRFLYTTWMNSFFYRAYDSSLMFSCLLNLSTNFLYSNCLQGDYVSNAFPLSTRSMVRNSFLVISIKHYGKTIKLLREVLNMSNSPELCSSISYILSLMSIYDPEANMNSINCFRDGLFSVISHHLNIAKSKGIQPSPFIPYYSQLMKNIERSVYLPSYDSTFLNEYSTILLKFDDILKWYMSQSAVLSSNMKFIFNKYNDLVNFSNDTLSSYLPEINKNIHNIEVQQEILFDMIHRWVRLFPSKLSFLSTNTHPLEKVLFLFYKVFKRALWAIVPQVKFIFLRDFETPLMSDIFNTKNEYDIFDHELDFPNEELLDFPISVYQVHLNNLKWISSYLIRLNSFFQRRTGILYKVLVIDNDTQKKFPIDDIRKWRVQIKDIEQARTNYASVIGISETYIQSFENTIIEPKHYPIKNVLQTSSNVSQPADFYTLQPNGLLLADFDPMSK
ncbi:hypothetical protein CLIB1423_09S02938 [[Candida] railenensis]|uniref:Zn(2)-C6 fungal-type domain-containing protein n=1 Tax=[Candida] railenensis TaxID=45579 RepID=A0A9P0VXZ8_9ASCO|nr:hypothetical protein CLIB1423_09S02938 [[Candida] railenensis]